MKWSTNVVRHLDCHIDWQEGLAGNEIGQCFESVPGGWVEIHPETCKCGKRIDALTAYYAGECTDCLEGE